VGFFKRFSKKNKIDVNVDLSMVAVDIHSHLIPGIDDGAQTTEDSLILIKELSGLGYKKIITTPHIMSDTYNNTPEIIISGLKQLRKEIEKANIPIEIDAAAEYYFDESFVELVKAKNLITFGTNNILFELPTFAEPPKFLETLFNLQLADYKPVIAHIERYSYWLNDIENYERLRDRGILIQVNLSSFISNSPMRKNIDMLLKHDLIDISFFCF